MTVYLVLLLHYHRPQRRAHICPFVLTPAVPQAREDALKLGITRRSREDLTSSCFNNASLSYSPGQAMQRKATTAKNQAH